MRKVAVVILNWNGKDLLSRFLPSVMEYSAYDLVDVIVADNGSNDNSLSLLVKDFPKVKIISLDKNYGFAGGYNKALEKVEAEYFVLLNSDVEVTRGWLPPLIDNLDKNKGVAACMPVIKAYHSKNKYEYAGASGGYIDLYGFPFCRGRIFDTIEEDNGQYPKNKTVFWASGACLVIRSSIFSSMNGFDTDFFAHMEEIDLCWRMKNRGFEINVVTESVVYHVGGGTLSNDSPNKLYLNFRNSLFMLYKNLPESSMRGVLLRRKILDGIAAVKFLVSLKPKYFMSVLNAHISFYKSIKILKEKRFSLEKNRTKFSHKEILGNSLVISYFLKGKKVFTDLDF